MTTPSPNSPDTRYRAWGELSSITLGFYVVALILLVWVARTSLAADAFFVYVLVVVTVFFLVRYLTTRYEIDDMYLYARRLVGSRRIALSEVRKIEAAKLRDLSPTGFFGSWGYRGRMWSPVLGKFDAVYTDPSGILVTPDEVPIFISPRDPDDFARELSRRVRSYTGQVETDLGTA